MTVYGTGTQTRSFCYVADLVVAHSGYGGETVEVLGGAADHLYVRARGHVAWVARGAAP